MNSETSSSDSPFPTSSSMGTAGTGSLGSTGAGLGATTGSTYSATGVPPSGYETDDSNRVRRMAQKAHETVDRLEQSIGSGSDRMMGWQQEYGDMAREQVRANPIAAIGVAFGIGIIFSKLFMR